MLKFEQFFDFSKLWSEYSQKFFGEVHIACATYHHIIKNYIVIGNRWEITIYYMRKFSFKQQFWSFEIFSEQTFFLYWICISKLLSWNCCELILLQLLIWSMLITIIFTHSLRCAVGDKNLLVFNRQRNLHHDLHRPYSGHRNAYFCEIIRWIGYIVAIYEFFVSLLPSFCLPSDSRNVYLSSLTPQFNSELNIH